MGELIFATQTGMSGLDGEATVARSETFNNSYLCTFTLKLINNLNVWNSVRMAGNTIWGLEMYSNTAVGHIGKD